MVSIEEAEARDGGPEGRAAGPAAGVLRGIAGEARGRLGRQAPAGADLEVKP